MHYEQIVKIKIQQGENRPTYGTGYRISNYHILTAYHVVNSRNSSEYELTSDSFSEVIDDPINIVFDDEEYDVAILEIDAENYPDLTEVIQPRIDKPATRTGEWLSAGYPKWVEDENGEREREPLVGNYEGDDYSKEFYKIKCTTTPKSQTWGGLSGAPIFDDKKNVISGIVRQFDTRTTTSLFDACTIWKLLKNPKFSFYFESAKDTKALKDILADPENNDLKKALSKKLNSNSEIESEDIIENLISKGEIEITEMLQEIKASNPSLSGVDLFTLKCISHKYHDAKCFNQAIVQEQIHVEVPAVLPETCELIMSARDNRDPVFKISAENMLEAGNYNIVSPPESGINGDLSSDIMDNISQGIADHEEVTERVFAEHRAVRGRSYSDKKKKNMAKRILQNAKGTYYWPMDKVSENETQKLQKLIEEFPLQILQYDADEDGEKEIMETELSSLLAEFVKGEKS